MITRLTQWMERHPLHPAVAPVLAVLGSLIFAWIVVSTASPAATPPSATLPSAGTTQASMSGMSVALNSGAPPAAGGTTRVYYIAADEVAWDYAPLDYNAITGQPFDDQAKVFMQQGPGRIGHSYRKAVYHEYTDSTFTQLKPRPAEWQHLGLLGPVIRATVGDTIVVNFKNQGTLPYSIHPHGVFYSKDSEGAPYNDGTDGADKADDAVPPGGTHRYTWPVPERAGPGPGDPSSILWMYHSHVNEVRDTNSGLIGPIIISRQGATRPDGRPTDVDREFVTLFSILDENQSWYLTQNIMTYAGPLTAPTPTMLVPGGPTPGSAPADVADSDQPNGIDPDDDGFHESNLKHSINGYVYGNLPGLTMQKGERVRWYVFDMGTEVDVHTPHWHGQTLLMGGMQRMDMTQLLPGMMQTLDMIPDDPGTWLFHCHVNDHIVAGMQALFTVQP